MKAWLACAIWWIPAAAGAQSVSDLRPPITISVGGGVLMPYPYPERPTADLFVSVQVPFSKSFILEGQVVRSTSDDLRSGYFDNRTDRPFFPFTTVETNHEALNVGGNLLMRTGRRGLKLFFGGGAGFHDAETRMRFDTRCEPRVAGGCDGRPDTTNEHRFAWSGPSWQLIGGVDARIAPRLTAFGGARWLTTSLEAGDTGLGALGGVRLALGAPAAQEAPPRGPTVRVSLVSGIRHTGELVSLSSSEVVVREEGRTQTFPLTQVSRVERTTHHLRNGLVWGLIVGFAGGYVGSCGGGDEEDCWPEVGALFAGIGAGAGAVIGAGMNRASAENRVLYSAPRSSVSVAPVGRAIVATPLVSPTHAGAALSLRW